MLPGFTILILYMCIQLMPNFYTNKYHLIHRCVLQLCGEVDLMVSVVTMMMRLYDHYGVLLTPWQWVAVGSVTWEYDKFPLLNWSAKRKISQ